MRSWKKKFPTRHSKRQPETASCTTQAILEHEDARQVIERIRASPGAAADHYFDARVQVLADLIQCHVAEEEMDGGMFDSGCPVRPRPLKRSARAWKNAGSSSGRTARLRVAERRLAIALRRSCRRLVLVGAQDHERADGIHIGFLQHAAEVRHAMLTGERPADAPPDSKASAGRPGNGVRRRSGRMPTPMHAGAVAAAAVGVVEPRHALTTVGAAAVAGGGFDRRQLPRPGAAGNCTVPPSL